MIIEIASEPKLHADLHLFHAYLQVGPEDREIHGAANCLELVAQVAQRTKAIIHIEEARFAAHRSSSAPIDKSRSRSTSEVFKPPI